MHSKLVGANMHAFKLKRKTHACIQIGETNLKTNY